MVGCRGFQDCQSEIPQNRQEPASAARRQEQQEALPVALQGDKEPVDSSAVAATAVVPDAATAPVAPDAATALSTSVASSASVTPSSSTASTSTATSPSLPANGRYLGVKTNLAAWAGTIMNVAAEVQVGKHLSVELPILWCPWHISGKHAVKTFTLQPEALSLIHI